MTVRTSLRDLDKPENARKKNDFLKAWKLIKELPPSNPNSFWSVASYHGMPYKNRRVEPLHPDKDESVWDGYCQHANVLFPTWHRFFCLRIEQALQTVVPSGQVALHYWDETSAESLQHGLPDILTQPTVTIDGATVPNPLLGFTIPRPTAEPGGDDLIYLKPAGYTTVRYPFSGIQYPPEAKAVADAHNKMVDGLNQTPTQLLQENCYYWLNVQRAINPPGSNTNSILEEFKECLNVPNYTVFSNTTSATGSSATYQALEQPHNDIHLMVGGFTTPMTNEDGSVKLDDAGDPMYAGLMKGANGDMGENETASFDPIFFFHHCNIDRMFWVWQKKWHQTDNITINPNDPTRGNTNIGQGPTPNQTPGQELTTETILYPFQDELGVPRTSMDCMNIESQLGYTYAIGSLDQAQWPAPAVKQHHIVSLKGNNWGEIETNLAESVSTEEGVRTKAFVNRSQITDATMAIPLFAEGDDGTVELAGAKWKVSNHIKVSNIEKSSIAGSFAVYAYYKKDDKLYPIGQRAVLDRWDRERCENCQKNPRAAVGFSVDHFMEQIADMNTVVVYLVSHDAKSGDIKAAKLNYEAEPAEKDARFDLITSFEQSI